MDRLRRSFRDSFRRRKDRVPESSKPHQWQADDQAVRSATCSFPVKYLGCVEVFESRGMQVCEEALKVLRVNILIDSFRTEFYVIMYFCRIRDVAQYVAFCMLAVTVYVWSTMTPKDLLLIRRSKR